MNRSELHTLSIEDLRNLWECTVTDFRYDKTAVIEVLIRKLKEDGQADAAAETEKDLMAFQLMTATASSPRFAPMMSGTTQEGEPWEYPSLEKSFTKDTIEQYRNRIVSTKNPMHRARYADVIWVVEKDYKYSQIAIDAYLELAPKYFDVMWDNDLADSLGRALSLAVSTQSCEKTEKAVALDYDFLEKLKQSRRFRYGIEIIQSLIDCAGKLGALFQDAPLFDFCEKAIADYASEEPDSFHLQRSFMELIKGIWKKKGEEDEQRKAYARIAESFVAEAQWKKTNYPSGNMVAAHFYEQALQAYTDLGGCDDKVEALKVELQEANKRAVETEYQSISVEVPIDMSKIDRHMKVYEDCSPDEFFELMSVDPTLVPSYNDALRNASKQVEQSVFMQIASMSVKRGNITVKHLNESDDKLRYQVLQNFVMAYWMMADIRLSKVMEEARKKIPDFADALIGHLGKAPCIDKKRLEILKPGLKAYVNEDFVSAIHVIVFQIEGMLRDMLWHLKLPTFSYRDRAQRERMLGDILETLQQAKGADQDLLKFIEAFLQDIMADNLRNDIAHGLADPDKFNRKCCELLILILIKIGMWRISAVRKQPATN